MDEKPNFNLVHPLFKLNGLAYSLESLKSLAYYLVKEGLDYEKSIGDFLLNWLDDNEMIKLQTSGSTGISKSVKISKQAMVNSALATGAYFKLNSSDTALLCLPAQYIAGKMMLVRAMVLGLEIDIIEPSSNIELFRQYDFVAMVPLQVQNSLPALSYIKTLIVGGIAVDKSLKEQLQNVDTKVFETYGMTETVSHIAVKPINHQSLSHFDILPDITIETDERGCLVIIAPKISKEPIVTNDIVKIQDKVKFEWLGRFDNVINSGGVKLFPEQIEAHLEGKIQQRFFIASQFDSKLGECLILIVEGESYNLPDNIFEDLVKYAIPKKVFFVPHFIETVSGKVQRHKTIALLED